MREGVREGGQGNEQQQAGEASGRCERSSASAAETADGSHRSCRFVDPSHAIQTQIQMHQIMNNVMPDSAGRNPSGGRAASMRS